MIVAQSLDVQAEVAAITAKLVARRDPAYEAGMRRTVPSRQPAHATRVLDIRLTAMEWRRENRDVSPGEMLELCHALWSTGWREERIVAILLIAASTAMLRAVGWETLEGWSRDIDNWEQVDHLATLTGRLLIADSHVIHIKN